MKGFVTRGRIGHYEKIRARDINPHRPGHAHRALRIAEGHNIVDVSSQLGHGDRWPFVSEPEDPWVQSKPVGFARRHGQ